MAMFHYDNKQTTDEYDGQGANDAESINGSTSQHDGPVDSGLKTSDTVDQLVKLKWLGKTSCPPLLRRGLGCSTSFSLVRLISTTICRLLQIVDPTLTRRY